MTIKLKDLALFSLLFDKAVSEKLKAEDCESIIHSDGSLTEHNLNLDFAMLIGRAGPWGQAFPEPVFDGIFQLIDKRIVGGSHLKLVLALEGGLQQFDAIAFNTTDENWPGQVRQVRLAYKLDINRFRGATQVQLMVEYIEPL